MARTKKVAQRTVNVEYLDCHHIVEELEPETWTTEDRLNHAVSGLGWGGHKGTLAERGKCPTCKRIERRAARMVFEVAIFDLINHLPYSD